tara:strand:+ start:4292 stop:6646 length:2355 start_codon:yes stop_codon:yes gene_type:complete
MADKIVAEYTVKVDEAIKNLNRLEKEVKDISTKGKKSAADIESSFKNASSSLISQFSKVGAALGIAFGAQQAVQLAKEMVTLAAQSEGVERAFKRIGSPEILEGLRKATRGTVTDLQLMQNAVKASNFKIPLENLASLFAFAQSRARETGESVDYLVDSIILGIGRKSPLILDNLGISAIELKDKLNGVGLEAASVGDIAAAVGVIATESLAKMGEQADTTADKIAQITTSFDNFKVAGGKELIGQFAELNSEISKTGELLNFEGFDGLSIILKGLSNVVNAVLEPFSILNTLIQGNAGAYQLLREILGLTSGTVEDFIAKQNKLSESTKESTELRDEEYISLEKLNELYKKLDAPKAKEIRNVAFLKAAIKDLTDQVNSEGIARENIAGLLPKINALEEELAILLGKQTEAMKLRTAELLKWEKVVNEAIDLDDIDFEKNIDRWTEYQIEAYRLLQEERAKVTATELSALDELVEVRIGLIGNESEREIAIVKNTLAQKLAAIKGNSVYENELRFALAEEAERRITEIQQTAQEKRNSESIAQFSAYANAARDITNGITNAIIAAHDNELSSLQNQLDAGLISREEFDKERRKIERKKAIDQKNAAIFDAVIATALAVANALSVAPPLGFVLAGIAGALGAVQIGVIASQPLPSFAEGGWVDSKGKIHGRSHAQGGVKIEAEGDEFIVKGNMARKNASLLEALNAGGGQDWINKNMVYPAIQNVLDSGLESNSGNWGNVTANLKDSGIIASQDRMRQSMSHGFKFLAKELKQGRNQKRGGYNA